MKKKILIAIDDGHGKETAGKRSPAFSDGRILKENDFNERTAEFLQEALQRNGFDTLMVAPEDTDTPLKTRVQRANDARADVYISIHANAHGTEWNGANGIETWVYEKVMGDSETYRLAKCVHYGLIVATGRKSRGIKRSGDLYVLNATRMHAVLVECGFMTNREEADTAGNAGKPSARASANFTRRNTGRRKRKCLRKRDIRPWRSCPAGQDH